jgi:hypothetical protein
VDLTTITLEQGLATLRRPNSPVIAMLKAASQRNQTRGETRPAAAGGSLKLPREKQAFQLSQNQLIGALLGGGLSGAYGYAQGDDEETTTDRLLRTLGYGLGGAAMGGISADLLGHLSQTPLSRAAQGRRGLSAGQVTDFERQRILDMYGTTPDKLTPQQAADYLGSLGNIGSYYNVIHDRYLAPAAGTVATALGGLTGYGVGNLIPQLRQDGIQEVYNATLAQNPLKKGKKAPLVPPDLPKSTEIGWLSRLGRQFGFAWDPGTKNWLQTYGPTDKRVKDMPASNQYRTVNPAGNVAGRRAGGALGTIAAFGSMLGLGRGMQAAGYDTDAYTYHPIPYFSDTRAENIGVFPVRQQAEQAIQRAKP